MPVDKLKRRELISLLDGTRQRGHSARVRGIRKVLVVNTADEGGGTERFAWLLFKGLEQRQIEAWMVVGQKNSNDPHVITIHSSPLLHYGPYQNFWHRQVVPALRAIEGRIGLESYRYPFSARLLDVTGSPPDIVLASNLHGGYFDLRALAALSHKVPVVIRPGDGWLATGHCAVPAACERWRSGCGRCPDLLRPPSVRHDLTRINWLRKRRVYQRARWSVVAPSAWQMNRLDQSILRHARGSRHIIRNGVDQSVFQPRPRDDARKSLGLTSGRLIGLVVANLGLGSPSKDFQTLRAALVRLQQQAVRTPIEVMVVGREGPSETLGAVTMHHRPHCWMPSELASYYQAADFLINPTHEETFSYVIAEAMSCGTPVLASKVAAVPEIVTDGQNGILFAPADVEALTAAFVRLASDDALRRNLSIGAAAYAKQEFSLERMIGRYLEVFEQVIDEHAEAATAAASDGSRPASPQCNTS
jgi:glycosyltransferase involved in cell wall biosynthesis